MVEVADRRTTAAGVAALQGQLTATLIAEPDDLKMLAELVAILEQKAGRLLLNGYPTGVEVCDAMVHGGPYPATSDARGTSVGTLAIDRFLRPVCYQNYPDELLPEALKNANPLGIWRLVRRSEQQGSAGLTNPPPGSHKKEPLVSSNPGLFFAWSWTLGSRPLKDFSGTFPRQYFELHHIASRPGVVIRGVEPPRCSTATDLHVYQSHRDQPRPW